MEDKQKSPVFKKKGKEEVFMMSFPKALDLVIKGEKITKIEWKDSNIYGLLKDGFLMLHKADNKFYTWIINDGDLLGEDWITLGSSGEIN